MYRAILGLSIALGFLPSSEDPKSDPKTPVLRAATPTYINELKRISEKYQAAKTAKMNVTKKVSYAFLDKPSESQGKLFISGKMFRLELEGNGKTIFLVKENKLQIFTLPKDSSLKAQVIESKLSSSKNDGQEILSALLSGRGLDLHFDLKKKDMRESFYLMTLQPKKQIREMQMVKLKVNNKSHIIEEIDVIDELENQTTFSLSHIEFNTAVDSKVFEEKIPKGAIVERL